MATTFINTISFSKTNPIDFSNDNNANSILILGYTMGFWGELNADNEIEIYDKNEIVMRNLRTMVKWIKEGKTICIACMLEHSCKNRKKMGQDENYLAYVNYYSAVKRFLKKGGIKNKKPFKLFFGNKEELQQGINEKYKDMKFDYIIQNPPYNGSMHLDFFQYGLDKLNEGGRMVIIEPATWLINVRKNGKAKTYDAIKQRINGHIESVVIENLNKEFGTELFMPFAITTIDMSKTFDTIDYTCCGETRKVKSVYDCNLVGDYSTIWSILHKVQSFGNMMKSHTTKEDKGREFHYTKYAEIFGYVCQRFTSLKNKRPYDSATYWKTFSNGEYFVTFADGCYHNFNNSISNEPLHTYDSGKKLTDKIADNIYGTKEELENWKHFIFNNKLPLFLNIVLTFDQHNNSKEFLPWLVDKQYTDDEINKLFGFTDEEIKLIDTTIKKYERNSPWFKRYMCGKDAVTDEEVNNFIAEISK